MITVRAITLVEMMVAVVIFVAMIAALVTSLLAGQSAWNASQTSSIVQREGRLALTSLIRDIRQAAPFTVVTNSDGKSFTIENPEDHTVFYFWSINSKELFREAGGENRIVARHITGLDFADDQANAKIVYVNAQYTFGVNDGTAQETTAQTNRTQRCSLKGKVVYRETEF
jgi:Tfp pilus assembly protein PilW